MTPLSAVTRRYVAAYAAHGDDRAAVGGANWQAYGLAQFDFLRRRGLQPNHRLLDLGCGTGRLARLVVPYLDPGKYTGLDIAPAVLDRARELATVEGWKANAPGFVHGDGTLSAVRSDGPFDVVWCYAAVAHMPDELLLAVLAGLSGVLRGEAYFAYRPAAGDRTERLRWKNFRHPEEMLLDGARAAGLRAVSLPDAWPNGQRVIRMQE